MALTILIKHDIVGVSFDSKIWDNVYGIDKICLIRLSVSRIFMTHLENKPEHIEILVQVLKFGSLYQKDIIANLMHNEKNPDDKGLKIRI